MNIAIWILTILASAMLYSTIGTAVFYAGRRYFNLSPWQEENGYMYIAAILWPLSLPLSLPIFALYYTMYGGHLLALRIGEIAQNLSAVVAARKWTKPDVKDEDEL